MKIDDFRKDQVWLMSGGPRRIVKVTSVGETVITINKGDNEEPERKTYRCIHVLATSPIYPIEGHVDGEEADITRHRRKIHREFLGGDMWTEMWIERARKRVNVQDPKIKSKGWEFILQVRDVIGRSPQSEGGGKGGSIQNSLVDGVLIQPEDVNERMFEPFDADEKAQAQLDQETYDAMVIKKFKAEEAVKAKEARSGPCCDNPQWGPVTRLNMQAAICGVEVTDVGDGKFCEKLRKSMSIYLKTIGINPWDVFEMKKPDFEAIVTKYRDKVSV